jgi:FAD dependent oxidoreductase
MPITPCKAKRGLADPAGSSFVDGGIGNFLSSAAPTAISRGKCFFSVPSSNGLPVCGFTTNWQIIACGTPKPTRILTLLRCSGVATKDFRPQRPGFPDIAPVPFFLTRIKCACGLHRLGAKGFVDASGDCDLAFFAGASTRYGNHGAVNLGTLGTRFGGIAPEADVSAGSVTEAIRKAKPRGVHPISKDRSLIARLPLSGDVVAYLASEDYDPRDVRSLSRAEISGRTQAWTYLEILRELPGWEHAYLASTGPEFGTRESRHINSVEQLAWQHVTEGRRTGDCVALGVISLCAKDSIAASSQVRNSAESSVRGNRRDISGYCEWRELCWTAAWQTKMRERSYLYR